MENGRGRTWSGETLTGSIEKKAGHPNPAGKGMKSSGMPGLAARA